MMKKKTVSKNELALARTKVTLAKLRQQIQVLPPLPALAPVATTQPTLTDVLQLGQLGLQPLVLDEKAEAVLSERVDEARILIKPTGAVYLPHIEYTRWFNRGFGRAQWALVPASLPRQSISPGQVNAPEGERRYLITQDFVLFVHGKPVAQAKGEQEYHESNADQSHGDVVEGLNASALRRVAKRLGVGDELWDRRWTTEWRSRNCCRVWVQGKNKPQWRRNDEKLEQETGVATDREATKHAPRGDQRPAQPVDGPWKSGPHANEKITEGQVKRLWAILRKSGRTKEELKTWLEKRYAISSMSDIKRGDYDFIVRCVEGHGPLPLTVATVDDESPVLLDADGIDWGGREPGAEG
jgi:hypothetical protein